MDPFGEILRKLFRYKFDTDTYEKEALHRDGLDAYDNALYHDTRFDDESDTSDGKIDELHRRTTAFPVFKAMGSTKCIKHGVEYLMSGPCPTCAYAFGLDDSKAVCAQHDVKYLDSSGYPVCAYNRGYEDAETILESVVENCTPLPEPNISVDAAHGASYAEPRALSPQPIMDSFDSFDLPDQMLGFGDSISYEFKHTNSWLRNEGWGAVFNEGPTECELEEHGRGHQAHQHEGDDVETIDVDTTDFAESAHHFSELYGATLSQISGLNDQLVKLLATVRRNAPSAEVEAAPMQLFLMTSVRSNDDQPSLLGGDLTPFLKTGESFLYYTVGQSYSDDPRPPMPTEIMANSIRSDLQLLSRLDSKALSRMEWASVRELRDKSSHIIHLAVADPLPQPAYIQELWQIWDEVTVLFKIGVQNLSLLGRQGAESTQLPGAVAEGHRSGQAERSLTRTTHSLPLVTAADEEQGTPAHPTDSTPRSSGADATGAESGWDHDQVALLRSDGHNHYDNSYPRSTWLSRFDSHLPEVCRQSQDLDPMLASLLYAITMLLKYEHVLPKPRKNYLNNIRARGEDVITGRSFYLAYSLQKQGSLVWDICWKIYFELSEDLPEEDDNFLSQLFHGRTSSCRYEEIRFPWSKSPKDNSVDPEHSLGNMKAVKSAVEAPLLTGYDQMIENAQNMLRERDRLGQPPQVINSGPAHKSRRKKGNRPQKEASCTMYDQMIENMQAAMREKDRLGRLHQETDETDFDDKITWKPSMHFQKCC